MRSELATCKADLMNEVSLYIKNEDSIALIDKAYNFAYEQHDGQFRKSGEPYFVHVLNVAYILAELRVGPSTIAAGLLHDTIEDCDVTSEQMTAMFSAEITMLVEAVTKIGNLEFKDEKEYLAANHRKIFIALAKDVRVILIKLVDRLHNMRTLQFMKPEKQAKIASETLEVYAPIAHRLGISEIKNELEDLSFHYLHPEDYYMIAKLVENKKAERDQQVTRMISDIGTNLAMHDIPYRIFGRSKHLYSIYKKMETKNKRFDEILDLLAIRIITKSITNCYEVLGHIHATYRPIPGRLKDYIAMPKMNMYQSLHTTIVGDEGRIFEVQIRTEDMDSIAEKGIAAHWAYKEGKQYDPRSEQKEIEEKLSIFKDLDAVTKDVSESASDFMDAITKDIFEANVYVMTPKGRVIGLPNGATTIDFAYRVHTEVGHSTVGAVVNEMLVPLNTVLKTGDVVQIRTSKQSNGPSEDWLKFVNTNQAKNKIRNFLLKKEVERKAEFTDKGEQLLRDEFRKRSFNEKEFMEHKKLESFYKDFQVSNYVDFMYAIAVKSISASAVVEKITNGKQTKVMDTERLSKIYAKETADRKKQATSKSGIYVAGVDSMKITIAQCCSPIPGDNIAGYITKGEGVKVHRDTCPNIINEKKRLITVEWEEIKDGKYEASIATLAHDRNFLLTDLVTVVSQYKASLTYVNSVVNNDSLTTTTKMTLLVTNIDHLHIIMTNLRKVNNVISVERTIK